MAEAEVVEVEQQEGMEFIPIQRIKESPVALRAVDLESEEFKGLVDSISSVGVLDPICVVRVTAKGGDGEDICDDGGKPIVQFQIVNGLHRYTACKLAGLDKIPCHILATQDERDILEAQIMANVHKIDTKPAAYARQLMRVLTLNQTQTATSLAHSLNKSVTWINSILSLTKLIPQAQDLVNQDKIPLLSAYALAKLPESEQANFLDTAMTAKTEEAVAAISARVKEIRDAHRKGKSERPDVFEPIARVRRGADLKAELDGFPNVKPLVKGAKSPEEAAELVMNWVVRLDTASVNTAEAEYNTKKKAREEAKAKAAAERQTKVDAAAAKLAGEAADSVEADAK